MIYYLMTDIDLDLISDVLTIFFMKEVLQYHNPNYFITQ